MIGKVKGVWPPKWACAFRSDLPHAYWVSDRPDEPTVESVWHDIAKKTNLDDKTFRKQQEEQ